MDYFSEALNLLTIIENLYTSAANLITAAQAKGDPTPAEVTAQMAAAQAANDKLHALLNGP